MYGIDIEDRKKTLEIDLLSNPKATQKWIPHFLRRQNCWKVFSGKWVLEPPKMIICFRDLEAKTGENLSIIGSPRWNDLTLKVQFRILTDTIKPPEGGTILYFLFKNIKNHYSLHFCLFKQKIEFIKRVRGIWTITAEQNYNIKTQKDYWTTISTSSGMHRCQVNGRSVIAIRDTDISRGCVGIGAKYCDVEFSHASISIPSVRCY